MTNEKIKCAAKLGYKLGSSSICIFPWHPGIFPLRRQESGCEIWRHEAHSLTPFALNTHGHKVSLDALETKTQALMSEPGISISSSSQSSFFSFVEALVSDLMWEKFSCLETWRYMCICFVTVRVGISRYRVLLCSYLWNRRRLILTIFNKYCLKEQINK